MTFAAYSLARQLAMKGHDWKAILAIVRAAGFRITAEQAIEIFRDHGREKIAS